MTLGVISLRRNSPLPAYQAGERVVAIKACVFVGLEMSEITIARISHDSAGHKAFGGACLDSGSPKCCQSGFQHVQLECSYRSSPVAILAFSAWLNWS